MYKFLVAIIIMLSLHQTVLGQKDTIIYVGDPMCSWCYGFSPELDLVIKTYPNVPLKIIVGGLRAQGKETFSELKSFLTGHWQEVHERTQQPFSYQILDNTELVYNTEPACRAVVAVRSLFPELEYKYFTSIQQAFYKNSQDPTSIQIFKNLAQSIGIDQTKFETKFLSHDIILKTEEDFNLVHSLGVRGFPSVLVLKDGKIHRISNGYITGQELLNKLNAIGF